MSKKLIMHFTDDTNKDVSLTVDDVKEDLTEEEVSKVMDLIIKKNIFNTSVQMIKKSKADIVETQVNEFKFK